MQTTPPSRVPARSHTLPVLALLAAALPAGTASAQRAGRAADDGTPPPNLLLVVADDLGVDMVGAYGEGGDLPPTPVIDSLAQGGVLFRNAWSNPVCSPTRATLQTGRYSFRTGIGNWIAAEGTGPALALDEVTLPELLDAGASVAWSHAAFGKWHLGNATVGGDLAPNLAGYSHFSGGIDGIVTPQTYMAWEQIVDGVVAQATTYATTATVDEALAWIQTASEPWLSYVAFHAPHRPYHAPPTDLHTIDLSKADPDPVKQPRPYYKAMVQALDTELGRLLAGLPAGQLDRTIVVFVGDNGTPGEVTVPPFPANHGKDTLFEGGVGVPLIVSGASLPQRGAESAALVNTTDLFATVAELAGIDLAATLPGVELDSVSLVPYLTDPALPSQRATIFAESFFPNGVTAVPAPPGCVPPGANVVCQPDLGFAGNGSVTLSLCDAPLYGYQQAELLLDGAPPYAPAWIAFSTSFNPMPALGGQIVPVPPLGTKGLITSALGRFKLKVIGGLGLTLYYQAAVLDAQQPQMLALSNALQVDLLSTDFKAVRNQTHKLIVNAWTCAEQLYDLAADPFEQTDLLAAGSLAPDAQASYDALRAALDDLLP